MTARILSPRELARCGLLGAAALLLPTLFHLVRLGHVFMPMYLPLVLLGFLVRPGPAATTALVTPLLSAAVTGMPPFYPPVAVFMALELAAMGAAIAWASRRWPGADPAWVLAPVLLAGRILQVALAYGFALLVELPAGWVAGVSLLSGWPGVLLMLAVVPPLARLARARLPAFAVPTPTAVNPRTAFFDGIAERWDGWEDLETLHRRLLTGLEELAVSPGEAVVDVGCGTGNLTRALLHRLGPEGRIVALDLSPRMVEVARGKIDDARVTWHVGDAHRLPVADTSCDRLLFLSVWPHLADPAAVAREASRVLRGGGRLHVWHLSSREQVNAIHAGAGEAVRRDVLPPAPETAAVLERAGFLIEVAREGDDHYLVTARLPR